MEESEKIHPMDWHRMFSPDAFPPVYLVEIVASSKCQFLNWQSLSHWVHSYRGPYVLSKYSNYARSSRAIGGHYTLQSNNMAHQQIQSR